MGWPRCVECGAGRRTRIVRPQTPFRVVRHTGKTSEVYGARSPVCSNHVVVIEQEHLPTPPADHALGPHYPEGWQ